MASNKGVIEMVSQWVCKECGSDRIEQIRTLVDENEDVICSFDYHKCLECAAEMRIERREEDA